MANNENLKPWPKGVSGNPGGCRRKKPVSEELERLLSEPAPNDEKRTWATVIAESLLQKTSKRT